MTLSVQKGYNDITEALMEAESAPVVADAAAEEHRVRNAHLLAAAAHGDVKRCKALIKAGARWEEGRKQPHDALRST